MKQTTLQDTRDRRVTPGRPPSGQERRAGKRPSATDRQGHTRKVKTNSGGGIKKALIINVVNQLAVLIDTGVPLSEALQGITDRTIEPKFRELLQSVTDDVRSGNPLSTALAEYPKAFPPIMLALLRASEASGTMSAMLNRIALYLTKENQTAKQVRGALTYPMFMFAMCIGVTVFLLTVVLPQFAGIYANRGAALPAPTRFLMAVSGQLVDYWAFYSGGTVALAVGLHFWSRTRLGGIQIDWLKLNTPILSNVFRKLYLSRACRTIGTMLETGVSLLETISIVRGVTRNKYYDRLWDEVDSDLRNGNPLSNVLYESPMIPDQIAQMIESGEKSGRLSQVFSRVADFAEEDFDQAVKTATQFIEPLMIVLMGSIIGFVAVALLIPIFSVGKVVAGG